MRALFRLTPLILAAGVVLAGCGRSPEPPADDGDAPEGAPAVGQGAPEIEGEDLDGRPMKLSDYRGKVVVLDFWGTW